MINFNQAKENMVKNQVMSFNVFDQSVLDAMHQVDRHDFVDDKWQSLAYSDMRVPLEGGRFMLEPAIFARMLDVCKLKSHFSVLDVACGSGYSSVVISKIVNRVIGVESINALATHAALYVTRHYLTNIAIKNSELLVGAPENAPFDVIIVNGALRERPDSLLYQLKHNGVLVAIEPILGVMRAVKYINIKGVFEKTELFDTHAEFI